MTEPDKPENSTDVGCHVVDINKTELYVVECDGCGFHLGIDASYLHSWSIAMACPNCQNPLKIEIIE